MSSAGERSCRMIAPPRPPGDPPPEPLGDPEREPVGDPVREPEEEPEPDPDDEEREFSRDLVARADAWRFPAGVVSMPLAFSLRARKLS